MCSVLKVDLLMRGAAELECNRGGSSTYGVVTFKSGNTVLMGYGYSTF